MDFGHQLTELPTLQVGEAIGVLNEITGSVPLTIEGEVAQFSVSRDVFVFFDLKDQKGEGLLSCFAMKHQLSVPLEDGMTVVVRAKAGIHAKSGRFRLTIQSATPVGEGSHKRAYELLLAKLKAEGLFAPERKRQVPLYPQKVVLITSAGAAAYTDALRALEGGIPVEVTHISAAVQGEAGEREVIEALDKASELAQVDVVLLVRGGGSIEDLHVFNSEQVARAIARCKYPVVVGVGHERDVTIADEVADVRAATPTSAVLTVVPRIESVQREVTSFEQRINNRIQGHLVNLRRQAERVYSSSRAAIQRQIHILQLQTRELHASIREHSPLSTLARGYAIVRTSEGWVRSAEEAKAHSDLTLTFQDGTISVTTKS